MQSLLGVAAALQVAAVLYCALLLGRHRNAPAAWLCLLGALLSMLVWRVVMSTGATPGPAFNTSIAIWGSACAVLAMTFFAREVAGRKRAEAERDQLLADERAARGEAERANRIKDEFLATLSHELRSPLAAILGWCTIARGRELPAEVIRAIDTIERNARVQTRLVDDLLDATRMQVGSLHLEVAPVALEAPVLAALEAVKPAAQDKKLTLQYGCDQPSPHVLGDASRLQQIASNLLVNAVKFTPAGGRIGVSLRTEGDHATLAVSDDGIGLDPVFVPHLFERFRQAETGHARRQGGLGLGLSIVSSLVRLHQGTVSVTSDGPGRGARFEVRLPLVRDVVLPSPLEAATESASTLQRLDGVRVIVVDDEADGRLAICGLLERAGATALALESGASIAPAIEDFRPDVLILDIGMPGEDGYSLIRRLRRFSIDDGGRIPAISLTAHVRHADRERALEHGFQAHLTKPVDLAALLATIRHLVPDLEHREENGVAARPSSVR